MYFSKGNQTEFMGKKPKKHHMDMTETIKLKIHGNVKKKKKKKVTWI